MSRLTSWWSLAWPLFSRPGRPCGPPCAWPYRPSASLCRPWRRPWAPGPAQGRRARRGPRGPGYAASCTSSYKSGYCSPLQRATGIPDDRFALHYSGVAMTRQAAIAAAEKYFDSGGFHADLARRIAIPTESQNPERDRELAAYLETEMAESLARMGMTTRIFPNPRS